MKSFNLTLGPLTLLIRLTEIPNGYDGRYDPFLTDRKADFEMDVEIVRDELGGRDDPIFAHENEDGILILSRFLHRAEIDLRDMSGSAKVTDSAMAFDGLLRMAFSELLPRRGAVLVHAAGIAIDEQFAIVFPGVSGAGKSTLSMKAGRERTLSDDVVLVEKTPHGIAAHGTPFWGQFEKGGNPISREVLAFAFPRQGLELSVSSISARELVLEVAKVVTAYRVDSEQANSIFMTAIDIFSRAPSFRLDSALADSFESIVSAVRASI
ncbi:MAG: hypothetical protein NUW37_04960 [Planctomycetes bacterium]|nr:hypothetical protein [Planctomycetota bacterium]